jgi:chromosome segregation ATPase
MDTASENIARANSKISELSAEIKEQEEKKKSLQEQIKDVEKQRERENEDFKMAKLDDERAVSLLKNAMNILKDWKNAKKSALISQRKTTVTKSDIGEAQRSEAPKMTWPAPAMLQTPKHLAATAIKVHSSAKQAPQFVVDAGEAPPPPPATWDTGEEYGGAGGEQQGIMGILEMVKEDVEKDISQAEAEEGDAGKEAAKVTADLEGEIKAADATMNAYRKDKAAQEKTVVDETTDRSTSKGELDGHIDLYNSYKPGCDFLLVNFDTRTKARQIEVDGLQKAKAILKGADFGKSFLQIEC